MMQWRYDSAVGYGQRGKMLIDLDENRYLIPNVGKLPARQRNEFRRHIYWREESADRSIGVSAAVRAVPEWNARARMGRIAVIGHGECVRLPMFHCTIRLPGAENLCHSPSCPLPVIVDAVKVPPMSQRTTR